MLSAFAKNISGSSSLQENENTQALPSIDSACMLWRRFGGWRIACPCESRTERSSAVQRIEPLSA